MPSSVIKLTEVNLDIPEKVLKDLEISLKPMSSQTGTY